MAKFIEKLFYRFWWVLLFLFICYVLYRASIRKKEDEIASLDRKMEQMQKSKEVAAKQKEDLQARIEAQNDPAWIEQVLKKQMGIVPEGQIKVHFSKEDPQ